MLLRILRLFVAKASGLPQQLFFQIADDLTDVGIDGHAVFDQTAGVQNGAVIAAAKCFADGVERIFGHLPREEHCDLSWERDVFRTTFARHVGQTDVKMFRDLFLNRVDVDGEAAFFVKHQA